MSSCLAWKVMKRAGSVKTFPPLLSLSLYPRRFFPRIDIFREAASTCLFISSTFYLSPRRVYFYPPVLWINNSRMGRNSISLANEKLNLEHTWKKIVVRLGRDMNHCKASRAKSDDGRIDSNEGVKIVLKRSRTGTYMVGHAKRAADRQSEIKHL